MLAAACSYDWQGATRCANGAKDGDETGVDCGGSCGPCASVGGGGAGGTGGGGGAGGGAPQPIVTHRWQKLEVNQEPPKRWAHAMAAQGDSGKVLLFSGYDVDATDAADTWTLDGSTWTKETPGVPPPARHYAGAAHDEGLNRTVVAGGVSKADAHHWDGTEWSAIDGLPGVRDGGAMVWDALEKKVLLFSPRPPDPMEVLELDSLQGAEWLAVDAIGLAPDSQAFFGAAYDRKRHRTVIFLRNGQTWEFERATRTWTYMLEALPPPDDRRGVAMAFDAQRERVVLFGGAQVDMDGTPHPKDETWEYDGATWQQVSPEGKPPPRFHGQMVWDAARNRMVLFGGANSTSNPIPAATWVYFVLGLPCVTDAECGSGYCTDDVCCEYDACPVGDVCNSVERPGVCVPP